MFPFLLLVPHSCLCDQIQAFIVLFVAAFCFLVDFSLPYKLPLPFSIPVSITCCLYSSPSLNSPSIHTHTPSLSFYLLSSFFNFGHQQDEQHRDEPTPLQLQSLRGHQAITH